MRLIEHLPSLLVTLLMAAIAIGAFVTADLERRERELADEDARKARATTPPRG